MPDVTGDWGRSSEYDDSKKREALKAGEHGPDRLYQKFITLRTKTQRDFPEEFIFTLRPEKNDQAAVQALWAYAAHCESTYPQLAMEIRRNLNRIRNVAQLVAAEEGVSIDQAYRAIADNRPEGEKWVKLNDVLDALTQYGYFSVVDILQRHFEDGS